MLLFLQWYNFAKTMCSWLITVIVWLSHSWMESLDNFGWVTYSCQQMFLNWYSDLDFNLHVRLLMLSLDAHKDGFLLLCRILPTGQFIVRTCMVFLCKFYFLYKWFTALLLIWIFYFCRYSPFLMACFNPETEEYQSVCRVMSGFSDSFYIEV